MLIADLRYALRTLLRRPGYAVVALLTLAIGIGANSAVFSIAHAALLRPLPFRDPERLVLVWEKNARRNRPRNVVNPGNYLEWRDRNAVFEDIAAFSASSLNLTGDGEPARVDIGAVTHNFFSVLGVAPALGRAFAREDGQSGARDVAILSDALFRRRFGGDRAVLGRDVVLNGTPTTIIGVMPPGFSMPSEAELWVSFREGEGRALRRDARGRFLFTVARLKPGVSLEQARAEMEMIAAQLEKERPDFNTGWSATAFPLHADLVREVRPAVLVLGGAVALLLLIACGNLANLLLARALGREREMAIRRALGAGRGRLVLQLLTESLVLAVLGGALGLLLASWLSKGLQGLVPPEVRALFPVGLDGRVLAFTFGLCVFSALVFGLLPAIHLSRVNLAPSLHDGAAGSGLSRRKRRLARVVVASELALSVVLLVGAGLLMRSFWRLSRADAGFRPAGVLTGQVSLGTAYRDGAKQSRFFTEVVARLAQAPGVTSAAAMSWLPLSAGSATRFTVADRPQPPAGQEPVGDVRIVTPGLFRTMGIPIKQGRDFEARDGAGRPDVVIVNEHGARELWPGESALGKRIRMEWGREIEAEVVAVVGDVRLVSLDTPARATLYWPQAQVPNAFMTLLVRSEGRPEGLAGALRDAVGAVDPGLPVARIAPFEEVVSASLQRPRFTFVLLGAFALTAALLAALGLFGVLSYSVAQRRPEMGVRLTLGARPADVARLVLGESVLVSVLGAAVGLLGALALSRLLASLLYEVSPRDPLALLGVTAVIVMMGVGAALLPAWRASRVDPVVVLRTE